MGLLGRDAVGADVSLNRKRRHELAGEAAEIVARSGAAQQHVIDPGGAQRLQLAGELSGVRSGHALRARRAHRNSRGCAR